MTSAAALIDKAREARTDRTRIKHARAALAIDPDELDGYLLLGQSLDDPGERLALYREGAARGRALWRAEIRRPSHHDFWLDLDTRPFMRLAHLLALELWHAGDRAAAIAEAEALLRLNPNDNQGIRELLQAWYPATGDWDALATLLSRYPDDWSTSHHYTRWLLACRRGEPTADALAAALDVNAHVPAFLADPAAEPDEEDGPLRDMGYVELGSPAEACEYAAAARPGWLAVPGAIERLVAEGRSARVLDVPAAENRA